MGGPQSLGLHEPSARLALLDGCAIWLEGRALRIPLGSQRLLALLALHDHPLQRIFVAGTLWGNHSDQRSIANLRTAMARLPRAAGSLLDVAGRQLSLAGWVSVDVRETSELARQVIDRNQEVLAIKGIHRRLMSDLLPDWFEDWVQAEQQRYRELRLHALEALCEGLTDRHEFGAAIEAGIAAVAAEPLRESAQRVLIRAYLAEGNRAAAVFQYRRFDSLLQRELGLAPSAALRSLVSFVGEARAVPG